MGQENLFYDEKLQKQTHNKNLKAQNYDPDNKVLLNSKYIKPKRNRKLELMFFRSF